jgi:hypothetical protein
MLRRAALLAPLLLVAACASDADTAADSGAAAPAAAAAPASAGDDLADVSAYELTMERMDRFYAVQRALGTRMAAMSPAEREALDVASDADDSMDETVRRLEGNETMAAALRDGGMSAREFTLLTAAIMQSGMAAAVLQMQPQANQDSLMREMKVNPANVRFLRENEAALQRKQAELQAEMQRLGLDTDG